MAITGFDHVNVRTSRLPAMIAWYGQVLDMHPGPRPPFSFGGAWLYLGDRPLVHLVEVAKVQAAHEPALEHFALRAHGLAEFLSSLDRLAVPREIGVVPGYGIIQVNVWDPDGNHIHIDFPPEERAALPAPS